MNVKPNQLDAAKLRRSLSAKLANEARSRGVAADQIRKQYIFTILLRRLFSTSGSNWVLLGGIALLIRTGGGRFTHDMDLARETAWDSVEAARAELQALADAATGLDPFGFDLRDGQTHRDADPFGYGLETGKVKAAAYLGTSVFESFAIDITTRRHIDAPVDQVPLVPVIADPTLEDLPTVPTAPVENHLADKICAMYEQHGRHGESPSTRYRDLADIVRIVRALPFEAARLAEILRREAGRRQLTLPHQIESPGNLWIQEYPKAARGFAEYPREFYTLDSSLSYAGRCLNEILNGSRATGSWDPDSQAWKA